MGFPSNDLLRNGSGYIDPTAYAAMKNIEKEQKEMYKRGQIYEYEVKPDEWRAALVVSADFRAKDALLNIIVLDNECNGANCVVYGNYFVNCGKVSFGWSTKMGKYIGTLDSSYMDEIDAEIMHCLGLERAEKTQTVSTPPDPLNFDVELVEAKTEARIYRELYERLMGDFAGCGKS